MEEDFKKLMEYVRMFRTFPMFNGSSAYELYQLAIQMQRNELIKKSLEGKDNGIHTQY